jgi:predicted dehydrogenase
MTISSTCPASESNGVSVRVAVVGCGFGAQHLSWLAGRPEFELATLCFHRRRDRAEELAARFGVRQVSDDPVSVLAGGDIELAVIVTPPHTRAELVPVALRAGAHVLVDKPLSNTVESARELTELASTAPGRSALNFQWRLHPAFQQLRDLIAAGTLGAPRRLHCRFFHDFFRDDDPSWDWRFDLSAAGGGALGDLGVHCFDLMHWLLPDRWQVTAATTSTIDRSAGGADDLADLWLQAERSACLATVSLSRVAAGRRLLEFVVQGADASLDLRIDPSDASATLLLDRPRNPPAITEFAPPDLSPYPQLLSLCRGEADGELSLAGFGDGLAAQQRLAEAQSLAREVGALSH